MKCIVFGPVSVTVWFEAELVVLDGMVVLPLLAADAEPLSVTVPPFPAL